MQAHLAELLLGDLLQAALLQKKLSSAALGVFFLLFLGFSSRGRSKQTQGCGMAVPRCAITPVTDSQGDGVLSSWGSPLQTPALPRDNHCLVLVVVRGTGRLPGAQVCGATRGCLGVRALKRAFEKGFCVLGDVPTHPGTAEAIRPAAAWTS